MTGFCKIIPHAFVTLIWLCVLSACALPGYDHDNPVVWQENARSQQFLSDLYKAGRFYRSELFESITRNIMRRLYPQQHSQFQVRLARLPQDNAFALPTGVVVFHLSLLAMLENEDQLAFVLAHEIAHLQAQHGYQSAQTRRRTRIVAQVTDLLNLGSGASFHHFGAALRTLSRQHEREADKTAARLIYLAGYDLSKVTAFFDLMQINSRQSYWRRDKSTHPLLAERRDWITKFLQQQETPSRQAEGANNTQEAPFRKLRMSVLPTSIRDKIQALEYTGALLQINAFASAGGDNRVTHCLRGDAYLGIANTDPEAFLYSLELDTAKLLLEADSVPKVFDSLAGKQYFYALALRAYLAALDPAIAKADSEFDYGCALRGAGQSSQALGQRELAAIYLRQYLQLNPDAIDQRYIKRLLQDTHK